MICKKICKKTIAILAASTLLCGLAGCGNKETGSSAPNNVQSVPQSSAANTATSTGASSENSVSSTPQRTKEIKSEIEMDGKLISLPCKVKDIGGITIDGESLTVTPAGEDTVGYSNATYNYNDTHGNIRLAGDCSDKTDLSEETVIGIVVHSDASFNYSGLTPGATIDDVVGVFGAADEVKDEPSYLRYYIDGDPSNCVDFSMDPTNGNLKDVRILLMGKD